MFSLVQGFYEELTYVPEHPVALLGVEESGKSSILEWLKLYFPSTRRANRVERPSSLQKITSTVGLNVAKLRLPNERLLVWDLGGARALRPIWERYIDEAQAIIWVVDSTDTERMDESRDALKKLISRPHLKHSPLLVFANKQDLENAMDPVKVSLALDMFSDAENRPQCVQPCSAETGDGLKDGIEWLIKSLGEDAKIEMRIP
ncbi:ADP-ribosylation factor-related protein 1 [Gracilariopsis chorda]|uniref:ADP-ribosylation factor-related protein 1 n=1 Tax=Gracilariopsis chorda TaxID=448386 RepID=A0A2V3J0H3_9FLOR|nr:ADP-ribosylation factor-related protein 1 [Gracilariopsis chorda]|eukprot:PXF47878.1 ADP-ribosylation factor-related protein 1 [Gracilariopsis chorda]